MRTLLHGAVFAALTLIALVGCSTAPQPSPSFGPLPNTLQVEVDAFYASLDRDLLNRDLNGIMLHYLANAEYSYRAYYPRFNEHRLVHRDYNEIQWYYLINSTALEADSIQELRRDFEYLPGVTRDAFTVRYKSFPRHDDGQFPAEPFAEVTVQFRRTRGTLQIRSVAAENLAAPDPPRVPAAVRK